MSFPPSFLEELRTRLPLSEVIGKRIRLSRAGREYKGCCPFHNEKTPSFYVNDDKQFFHCFGCGAHGDIIGFTMRYEQLSFPEAIENLAAQAGVAVPRDTPVNREQFDQEKRLYQLLERTSVWFTEQLFSPAGREALNYLQKRGLNEEAIRRFQLGYAPNDGQSLIRKLTSEGYKLDELMMVGLVKKSEERNDHYSFFRDRVIFPVGDRRGRCVAFGGRVMGDGEPKYLNSPDHPLFHKGKLLYGLSRARTAITQNQPIIVVEGYMDVIALVQAGFTGAVAPLGTALTEDQMTILWKLLPPPDARDPARDYSPILCFDGDNAGMRAAVRSVERALPLLTPWQTFRVAFVTGGKDPDEVLKASGKSAMERILTDSKPMIDMLWDMTLESRRMGTPEERSAFTTAIRQRVSRIAHEDLRQLYQDEVQKRISALMPSRQQQQQQQGFGQQRFQKGGQNSYSNSYGRGKSGWQTQPISPVMARGPLQNPKKLRERVFLAVMINYPSLFADFGEDFAQMDFATPVFNDLRQRVVDILSLDSHEPLDAEALNSHLFGRADGVLEQNRAPEGLADVLSEATYMHAGFARPGQSVDAARKGWKSLWNNQVQEKLEADFHAAHQQWMDDRSDASESRMTALRREVELLRQEAGNLIMTETSFSSSGQE